MACLRVCLLALVATIAQAEVRGFLAQEPEDGSDELQADSDEALFGKSDEGESDSALYGNALLQQEPEDGSDELQADSDEALFGKSDEGESDSALYGNALLQQEPEDGSDELQADSDEALFGKSDEGESDSSLYGNALLQQEPEDGSDELQADSDEALFGKSDEGESDSALYGTNFLQVAAAPADELAKEMTHDLEMNFNKIAPFGKEDTAKELQDHASKTQDTLVDAVENAEVAEIKRAVFRALTRLRAATIKEFDTIARLETQAIDAYNDAHHYRAENPLAHLHEDEAPVETDKLKSFH